jgi:hypothetical protein
VAFDGNPAAGVMQYRAMRHAAVPDLANRAGIAITGVEILDQHEVAAAAFHTGGSMAVRIRYDAAEPIHSPHFAVDVFRDDGVYCFGINSRMDGRDFGTLDGSGIVDLEIPRLWLVPGSYTLSAGILDSQGIHTLDLQHHAYHFSVMSARRNLGIVYLDRTWSHHSTLAVPCP